MQIKRDEHLYARVTPSVKEAAERAAERAGITLSTLVFEAVRDRVQNEESTVNNATSGVEDTNLPGSS